MHKNMRGAFPLLHADFSFLEVQYTAGGPLLGIVATFLFIHATNPTRDLILLAVTVRTVTKEQPQPSNPQFTNRMIGRLYSRNLEIHLYSLMNQGLTLTRSFSSFVNKYVQESLGKMANL